uniref:C-type lectin domain-containing protein n=1 Tax=Anabas testudineus TaxID=64144 RepID=A0A3Q1H672_ANATE
MYCKSNFVFYLTLSSFSSRCSCIFTHFLLFSVTETTCPDGWIKLCSSCYFFSTESGSWTTGREDCRTRGADLVVIDSAEEQVQHVFMLVDNEGSWKWVDGTPLILNNWWNNQPDNGGGSSLTGDEDCAHIRSDSEWNDLPCEKSLQWICEKML